MLNTETDLPETEEGRSYADFNPSHFLLDLKGKAYLPVWARVVALRRDHPDAKIISEMVQVTEKFALFKATITLPSGAAAQDYGSETPQDFGDYIEKASTKAIGRACGALGYGTASALDFGEDSGQHVVDSPIGKDGAVSGGAAGKPASEKQIKAIFGIAWGEKNMNADAVKSEVSRQFAGKIPEALTSQEASKFIEWLKAPTPIRSVQPARTPVAPAPTVTEPERNYAPIDEPRPTDRQLAYFADSRKILKMDMGEFNAIVEKETGQPDIESCTMAEAKRVYVELKKIRDSTTPEGTRF